MPLPWSKSKVSRLSRIVKDFQDLQSPKRCNSLVVETGFPTSLVDLFVKNRDRLKKSKRQKKKKQRQEVVEELVITDAIPLAGFRDSQDHVYADNKIDDRRVDNLEVKESVSEFAVKENGLVVVDDDGDVCRGRIENEKGLVLVFFKMFVLVALGLSTKRVAVGITMSAFVLILMEYVGKHILCFFKPCSKARLVLDPFAGKICSFLLAFKRLKSCESSRKLGVVIREGGDSSGGGSSIAVKTIEFDYPVEEIKGVDSRSALASQVEESRRKDVRDCDEIWESSDTGTNLGTVEEDEDRSGGLVSEKESSIAGKTKRKIIKKLNPKKLFARKKGKNGKEEEKKESNVSSEASSCWEEDKLGKSEVTEKRRDGDRGKVISLTSQLIEGEERRSKGNRGGKEESHSISSSCTKLHIKTHMTVKKEAEVDQKGNSGYVIVLVVVLAGLMGGRIVALLLTVASCLMLKLVGRCRRHVNGLMNRSPP